MCQVSTLLLHVTEQNDLFAAVADHGSVLAICFKVGDIYLMSGYDDPCPCAVHTTLQGKTLVKQCCYSFQFSQVICGAPTTPPRLRDR